MGISLIFRTVAKTGRMLVADEDYQDFGLSGELAAVVLEAGISIKYSRVRTNDTIPFSPKNGIPHSSKCRTNC